MFPVGRGPGTSRVSSGPYYGLILVWGSEQSWIRTASLTGLGGDGGPVTAVTGDWLSGSVAAPLHNPPWKTSQLLSGSSKTRRTLMVLSRLRACRRMEAAPRRESRPLLAASELCDKDLLQCRKLPKPTGPSGPIPATHSRFPRPVCSVTPLSQLLSSRSSSGVSQCTLCTDARLCSPSVQL